jgi:hypothetical protein
MQYKIENPAKNAPIARLGVGPLRSNLSSDGHKNLPEI